ncbi:MAG: hypothetical protein HC786_08310 [Richelia sp. CSU_2_1]|nr:hypothetical protein [Richelia sp. CSU_2_1]
MGDWERGRVGELPITNYQLPIPNYQLSTVNYLPVLQAFARDGAGNDASEQNHS